MTDTYIAALVEYALSAGLIEACDRVWAVNALLEVMKKDDYTAPEAVPQLPLEEILKGLLDDAAARASSPTTSPAGISSTPSSWGP